MFTMSGFESILEENRVYKCPQNFASQANITKDSYEKLKDDFKTNPEKFWADLAKEELIWMTKSDNSIFENNYPFKTVLNKSKLPYYKWFEGGKINISANCIDRHLEKRGDKAALVWEGEPGDRQSLSYKELSAEVNKLANALKSLGVKKADVVTIYMPLCPQAVIAMHACNRIGAVHSVVFGGFSAEALKDRIIDCNSKLVITADGLFRKGNVVPLIKAVDEAIKDIDHLENVICYERVKNIDLNSYKTKSGKTYLAWTELLSKQSKDCAPEALDAEDISFILYTSGSTGKPKGVQHRTAGYLLWTHLTSKWVFDLKEDDIYWCTADVGWITGHSYVAYGPLSNGATCFMYEGAPNFPEANRFWDLIERYKVSIFYTAPTAIRAFNAWGVDHINKHDLSSLRLLGTVGEPINPDIWVWYYENIGKSKCPVVDTWWQTETGGLMITTLPGVHDMVPGRAGLPLPGIDADISDEGLLVIKSPWVSMLQTVFGDDQRFKDTYWRSVESLEKLTDLKAFDEKKTNVYLAGDGAHRDPSGFIEIMGRVDDMINVSGHRLGTAEIESSLVSETRISEAAVVAIPHKIKGEGIIAYVVLNQESAKAMADANGSKDKMLEDFKAHVVKQIGAIARPEKIIICSGLPKTRSGKIMRRLLRDLAQGKKPSGDISTIENSAVLDELMKA